MSGPAIDPNRDQRRAADPLASAWVAASAGSGKTRVLSLRVLALLLAGAAPERLLCLTFTKAAAAEMANRVVAETAIWAGADESALAKRLADLFGETPDAAKIAAARRLFARVLDCPGGLKVETIHAFCQSLLRRFPIEAGLAPHFSLMDERAAALVRDEARDEILADARAAPGSPLARALTGVTARIHENRFGDLLNVLAFERGRIARLLDRMGGLEPTIAAIYRLLGVAPEDTPERIVERAAAHGAWDEVGLKRAVRILETGSKTDKDRAAAIAQWLAAPGERIAGFDAYVSAFLTKEDTVRETLITKNLKIANPGTADVLGNEARRLSAVKAHWRAAHVAEATSMLLSLAVALLDSYDRKKRARALLDYDDLILTARRLMENQGAAWVHYKLDGGIDHVLIDEAQDTNPDQWQVVAALVREFFAGEGRERGTSLPRTIFAVGDAKQSIYSFQRADPREFDKMRRDFAAAVPAAGRDWREVPLTVSFRSAQAVLDAVDATFQRDSGGLAIGGPYLGHVAFHGGLAGRVELWPPVAPRPLEDTPPWKPPVERLKGDSPRTRLANLLAARLARMIGHEELPSRGRKIRAGDIMVLVRRRGPFVEDLVRALKERKVEVAGADRMKLAEQIAVMDLMAAAQFALLPEDDLNLAALVKSPLIGLGEEELFNLAHGRDGSLWGEIRKRAGEAPYAEAYRELSVLLAEADFLAPYEFFSRLLGPRGGRRRLMARLGLECEDPIDEFMSLALLYERGRAPSLQGFLHWLVAGDVEVKRELEQAKGDSVRIMTVHGSKGLEAPVVILPDTMSVPKKSPALFWAGEEDLPLWPPQADLIEARCEEAKAAAALAREEEYRRLLYVAMTRAEDRLILCGWVGKDGAAENCWYDLVEAGIRPSAREETDPFFTEMGETESDKILVLETEQTGARREEKTAETAIRHGEIPAWAHRPAPAEGIPAKPLAPSKPEGDEPAASSPLSGADTKRFARGRLIHKMLEHLPDIPESGRAEAARRFLARQAPDLDAAARAALAAEALAVVENPAWADLFRPGSRAEVAIAGLVDGRAISGQVDRLVVTEDKVLILDYKTNRPPPTAESEVPSLYRRQMEAYRSVLKLIYPGRSIHCLLLWTDGPNLMEIAP